MKKRYTLSSNDVLTHFTLSSFLALQQSEESQIKGKIAEKVQSQIYLYDRAFILEEKIGIEKGGIGIERFL
jgi:hypothetical protein